MPSPEMSKPATPEIPDSAISDMLQAQVAPQKERAEIVLPADVLRKVEEFAQLKREDLENDGPITNEDWENAVSTHLAGIYTALFPPIVDETPTPSPITSEALLEAQQAEMDFAPIYEALSRLVLPGTNIKLFQGGGSVSIFNMDGGLRSYSEVRKGVIYGTEDNPFNSAPYTVSKPAFDIALTHVGRRGGLGIEENCDFICDALGIERSKPVHMGGLVIKVPGDDGELEDVYAGISCAELSPEALEWFLSYLRSSGAEASIDDFMDGLCTGAGLIDERIAGRVAEAVLQGKSSAEIQHIADEEWAALLRLAVPGPLPARCS